MNKIYLIMFSFQIFLVLIYFNCFSSYDSSDNKINDNNASSSLSSNIYYVAKLDASGDPAKDTNPGTESSPWLTIQKAANTLNAGETVYIKTGIYNEQIVFKKSGNSSSGYITFQNYETDTVIIDGTGITVLPNAYYSLIGVSYPSSNISYIKIIGLHVQNVQGGASGIQFQGTSSNILNHIEISGCEISNTISTGPYSGVGIRIIDASDFIIQNCIVYNCDTGGQEAIRVGGNVNNFTIINCYVHDNSNIGIDICGRVSYGIPTNGIIQNNICANNSYANHTWSGGAGIYLDNANYITIQNNICYGNVKGIAVGNEDSGTISQYNIVKNNICFENLLVNIIIGGNNTTAAVSNCTIRNNTTFHGSGAGELRIRLSAQNNTITQNILGADHYWTTISFDTTTDLPYNNIIDYNSYPVDTLLTWPNLFGSHNIYANPRLVDPTTDFHLQSSSPCINAGDPLNLPSGEIDYYNQSRLNGIIDIGATEYY